jgi:hypothetical protein
MCVLCGKGFPKNQDLQRHLARKRPCVVAGVQGKHICRHCGKNYSRSDNLNRHVKTCYMALKTNEIDENMPENITSTVSNEGTLTQQLSGQLNEQRKINEILRQQLAEIQAHIIQSAPHKVSNVHNEINSVDNSISNVQTINVVHVHPWDSDRRLVLDVEKTLAAFTENARLREYTMLHDHDMGTPAIGAPYVLEMLIDLARRAHEDPANRNIYLNPKRVDQVLILKKSNRWEILSLQEATRLIFDEVAAWMHVTTLSPEMQKSLPMEARNALAFADQLYNYEPEEYVKKAKNSMAAHFENCRSRDINTYKMPVSEQDATGALAPTKQAELLLQKTLLKTCRLPVFTPCVPDERYSLNAEKASAAFLKFNRLHGKRSVDETYIRELARTAGAEVSYFIKKLWEAVEDGDLAGEDVTTANKIIAKYDEDQSKYD